MNRTFQFVAFGSLLVGLFVFALFSTGVSYAQGAPSDRAALGPVKSALPKAESRLMEPSSNSFPGNFTVTGWVSASSFYIGGNIFDYGSYSNGNAFLGFAGNGNPTNGTADTAVGYDALYSDTTGVDNTAVGAFALESNTTGSYNTASGTYALHYNVEGFSNSAFGYQALFSNTGTTNAGAQNTAVGYQALFSNTGGFDNTGIGSSALSNTTGYWNTGVGAAALYSNTTGTFNTALGTTADVGAGGLTNATAIGACAIVAQSNSLVLGGISGTYCTGSSNTNVGIGTSAPTNIFTIGQGFGPAIADGWDTYSSRRWKTNIRTLHGALGKVEQLRGVSYDQKDSGKHEIGVIAEEVGAVVPEVVSWEKNGKDAAGVDYARLTALLIEATKEQQALIEKQAQQLQLQQTKIEDLTRQVSVIQTALHQNGELGSTVLTASVAVH